jgi:hypothetical protein
MSDERYTTKQGLLGRAVDALLVHTFRAVNKVVPWHKLPWLLGVPNLIAFRVELRKYNLHDTDGDLTQPKSDFSAVFVEDDLLHAHSLLDKLLTPSAGDLISAWLWDRFSSYAKALLPRLQAQERQIPATELKTRSERNESEKQKMAARRIRSLLVAELNKIIRGARLPDALFAGLQLSPQTTGLAAEDPCGDDLAWLNRGLLEDAYPLELRRNRERRRVCLFHAGPFATHQRNEDGTMNNLTYPAMGCRFSRLGHNMLSRRPLNSEPGLLHPNPLLISERLLSRGGNFQPATTLNLLAGAWIQFQVHDWFGHENEHQDAGRDIRVPKAGSWPPRDMGLEFDALVAPGDEMVIPRTAPDPTNSFPLLDRTPAFRNKDPQWWDGSQIYGESVQETLRLRTDPDTNELCPHGRLYLDNRKLLPRDENEHVLSGFTDNWWVGMELLHTLFAQEHNAICERLCQVETHLTVQEIFETARLINCAIMAKIHSVEWTPGILDQASIQPALDANWMGLVGHFAGEKTARAVAPWIPMGLRDVLTGIPLSEVKLNGAPYALSEEFNAVYRLHPLIPDEVPIRRVGQKEPVRNYPMIEVVFEKSRRPIDDGATMDDLVYSFGVANPGSITIRNYPDFLRKLILPKDLENGRTQDQVLDLAAVDIIRDRERGVPRYNEFRRQLRMKPAESWAEMSGDRPDVAQALEEIYGDPAKSLSENLETVDNMVGMFCEKLPEGFGFSDTAFRVFILMASRRLSGDRFFTSDYTAEFYTQTGLDWIAATGMTQVLARHHPDVARLIPKGQNPFYPWDKIKP